MTTSGQRYSEHISKTKWYKPHPTNVLASFKLPHFNRMYKHKKFDVPNISKHD